MVARSYTVFTIQQAYRVEAAKLKAPYQLRSPGVMSRKMLSEIILQLFFLFALAKPLIQIILNQPDMTNLTDRIGPKRFQPVVLTIFPP